MKRMRLQKLLAVTLAVTTVLGTTMMVNAKASTDSPSAVGTNSAPSAVVSSSSSASSEAEEVTAAPVPTKSEVSVGGQKVTTTVTGAYLAKSVSGIAVTTPAASIKGAYGLKESQSLYAKIDDTDRKKSHMAMASLNAAAAAYNATMGPVLNINLGYMENGKYTALSADGPEIEMVTAIPEDFQDATAQYGVVIVRAGGAIKVLPDMDDNPATVTFNISGGLGCCAFIKY